MDARPKLARAAANGVIDRELVRAGVDAELQARGQAVLSHRVADDRQVVGELLVELVRVADIVHALVEAAREFRCDGLDRDALVGDGREDDQQFGGSLRVVGLVHRDLGDEVPAALGGLDVPVDPTRFLHGEQELGGSALDAFPGGLEGPVDALDLDLADEFGMCSDQGVDRRRCGGFADGIRDVEREEVARVNVAVDRVEVDMVGIDVVGLVPAQFADGLVRRGPHAGGLGADREVLAVGLVPGRDHLYALLRGQHAGPQLRSGLVSESVADSKRILLDLHCREPTQ